MPWSPISGQPVAYAQNASGDAASGYYLKFYAQGTTTPINMASDSTGGGLLAKCQLNASGYPLNGSSDIFIPYLDQNYRIALYPTEALADANTLASATWYVDVVLSSVNSNITLLQERQLGSSASGRVFTLTTITYTPSANNLLVFQNGQKLVLGDDYTETSNTQVTIDSGTPINSADTWEFVTNVTSSLTTANTSSITHTEDSTTYNLSTYLQNRHVIVPTDSAWGAAGDRVTDDTAALQAAIDTFKNPSTTGLASDRDLIGRVLDLKGKEYLISSPLNFDNCSGMILKNGTFIADAGATWGASDSMLEGDAAINFVMENVVVECNEVANGIHFNRFVGAEYNGLKVYGFYNQSWGFKSSTAFAGLRCLFNNPMFFGIKGAGTTAATSATGVGLLIEGGADSEVIGGEFNRCAKAIQTNQSGWRFTNTKYTGNGGTAESNTSIAIDLNGAGQYVIIDGNEFDNSYIRLEGVGRRIISDNFFRSDSAGQGTRAIEWYPLSGAGASQTPANLTATNNRMDMHTSSKFLELIDSGADTWASGSTAVNCYIEGNQGYNVPSGTPLTSIRDGIPPWNDGFHVYLNSNQTNVTGNGTVYTIPFDTEEFDHGRIYDTGTSTGTIVKPGLYMVTAQVMLGNISAAADSILFELLVDGEVIEDRESNTNNIGDTMTMRVGALPVSIAASGTITARVTVSGEAGDTVTVNGNAIYRTFISAVKID